MKLNFIIKTFTFRDLTSVLCLFMTLIASPTWAGYITTMDNGPSYNRIDAVFLGDGYTAGESAKYLSDTNTMLDYLFNSGQDPFPRYKSYFNAHVVDVVSNQSGADDPNNGIYVDTALDASYAFNGRADRLLYINESKADAALAAGLGGAFNADMQLVTVNTTKYGGGGGNYAVWAGGNESANEVALHELGHSFGGLADEYGGGGTNPNSEPTDVNITNDPTGAKWNQWLGFDQPGIGVIGAYEGGGYYDEGIYRPSDSSKMRVLGNPFDVVSREELILDMYRLIDPLDGWLANIDKLFNPGNLWVDAIDSTIIDTHWYVDGLAVANASGEQFNPLNFGYGPGTYDISARSFDNTDWVRRDLDLLRQDINWTVTLFDVHEPSSIVLLVFGLIGLSIRKKLHRPIII
jgi:hypothetical protein